MLIDLLTTAAAARALVVGLFGGVGLVLLAVYSRRGPLVFPVYAAILAALAAVLSRDAALPFAARYAAALLGFAAASAPSSSRRCTSRGETGRGSGPPAGSRLMAAARRSSGTRRRLASSWRSAPW